MGGTARPEWVVQRARNGRRRELLGSFGAQLSARLITKTNKKRAETGELPRDRRH
jgi:hypothetical protein